MLVTVFLYLLMLVDAIICIILGIGVYFDIVNIVFFEVCVLLVPASIILGLIIGYVVQAMVGLI